jgi:hypothetical protein
VVGAVLLLLASVGGSAARCIGDCDGDGRVSIYELIRGVPRPFQPNFPDPTVLACFGVEAGGTIAINILIQAVNNALNGCPPSPTPTETPTATVTFTETPTGPGVRFDPPGVSPRSQVLVQFESCSTSFDLRIGNGGPAGSSYTVRDVSIWHGYSQGDYSRGFSWSLDGITFPVILRDDANIVIPISYSAEAFDSRLHVAVNPSGPGDFGEYHAIYRGRSETTCHSPEKISQR